MQERPLHDVLDAYLPSSPARSPTAGEGSVKRPAVEVGPCFDQMEPPEGFLAAIAAAFAAGFRRVKLKIRPGWALEMLRAVRQDFPGDVFHVDCEGALSLNYMEMLYRFDDFALEMVEQPLAAEDLVAHAMLQESLRTPICLDESIASPLQSEMALDLKSCRYVNLKAGRVGGLTAAMTILDACRASEVDCWGGAAAQSAIGARADLALAVCTGSSYPADFFPSESDLADDLAEPLRRFATRATARCESRRPRKRGWELFPIPECWRNSRCRSLKSSDALGRYSAWHFCRVRDLRINKCRN